MFGNKKIKILEQRIKDIEDKQLVRTFSYGEITLLDLAKIVENHIQKTKKTSEKK